MACRMGYDFRELIEILLAFSLIVAMSSPVYAQTVSYDYDELDRMKRASYLDGTVVDYSYDSTGNRASIVHSLDTTAASGSVEVNSGATSTGNSTVTLSLTCPDTTGCLQMQFSNDGVTYSTPEFYSGSKVWALSSGDGTKCHGLR